MTEVARHIESLGHDVTTCSLETEALGNISETEFDLVIVESRGEDRFELDVLRETKRHHPGTEVIIIAELGTIDAAVTAMNLGAFHYLEHTRTLKEIRLLAQQALERRTLTLEVDRLRKTVWGREGMQLIGESPRMQETKRLISRIAPLDCTVIIRGETGTGKELVSRIIHRMSPRAHRAFLAVNCGAFNEDLLRNELFGHEREAFTGAVEGKKGVFEALNGGTLLLDEIGDMSQPMQMQLLRVLQEKTVTRIGGLKEVPVDVRVLAATNRALKDEVAEGHFREDLYYRLNTFTIRIPPLRDRRDDIPLFCRHFLNRYCTEFGKEVGKISNEVMDVLLRHPFPGNVRELENVIERAVALTDGVVIDKAHLPRRFLEEMDSVGSPDTPEFKTLSEAEKRHIREVLDSTGGNKTRAAEILGIDRVTLWRKLKKHGLEKETR